MTSIRERLQALATEAGIDTSASGPPPKELDTRQAKPYLSDRTELTLETLRNLVAQGLSKSTAMVIHHDTLGGSLVLHTQNADHADFVAKKLNAIIDKSEDLIGKRFYTVEGLG